MTSPSLSPPASSASRWPRLHLAVAMTAAILFVVLLEVILPASHDVTTDLDVATWMAAHRTAALTTLFTAISYFGSVLGIVPLAIVVSVILYRRNRWRSVRWLGVAVVGSTALYLITNYPIGRARPPSSIRLYPGDAWSFPSGHSTQSVVFWIAIATLLAAEAPRRTRAVAYAGAVLVIAAIGLSRIYLGMHWTTDVLGGFSLGACWIALVLGMRYWLELVDGRLTADG